MILQHKRPLLPDVMDFKAPKKTRIAHNAKKQSPTAEGTSSCSPPSKYDVSSTTKQSPDHHVSIQPSKPQEKEISKCQEPVKEAKIKRRIGKLSPSSDVSSTSNGPDYLK